MATKKQILANRLNAAKSKGPTTEDGKAIASRNSLKHGLLAKEIVVKSGEGAESQEEFDVILSDLKEQFAPQGTIEEILVEKITTSYWRLRRAHRFEVGLIGNKLDCVTYNYYKEKQDVHYNYVKNKTEKQIDDEIAELVTKIKGQKDLKKDFIKLQQSKKDLKEIYCYPEIWDVTVTKLRDEPIDFFGREPANVHSALNRAGWTDDKIWQFYINTVDTVIASLQEQIKDLQMQKDNNKLAIQVKKKIGCIPEGNELERLLKYEGSIEKQFYKALNELERLQRMRKGDTVPPPVNIDLNINKEEST
jgi:hypothetical protein